MASSASVKNNNTSGGNSSRRLSSAMERTGQWVFSQEISSDVIVQVGEAKFPLHKFILVTKSGYIRRMIMESTEADLTRIDLSDIPGGSEMFEKAAKFCYGVNFEINVHNVAPLLCASHYLEMTESYCEGNLVGRTEEFLSHVALKSLSGALAVLISCHQHHYHHPAHLLPVAEDLKIVQRCLDVASAKACNEANFPSRSPANWWMEELAKLDQVDLFKRVITGMKSRGAKTHTLATALKTYTEKSLLRDLVRDHSSSAALSSSSLSNHQDNDDAATGGGLVMIRKRQQNVLETIVSILPSENGAFPVNFLCYLLRSATFLEAANSCKRELENRISAILEHVTVADLLVLSFTLDGEKLFDLESVRLIISGFVDKEKSVAVFNGGGGGGGGDGDYYFSKEGRAAAVSSRSTTTSAMQKVAKMVDAYLGEIATYPELSISKFNGIANLVPKEARKVDDDLYRSIDIYLKVRSVRYQTN
ncbi:BTB/POZ-like [Macleaya cordata]|uniref:BTB/POZ-like n=1 Tax=Macleaya cordata TaxID=56857 RepID=A0A200QI26_MACCD|nr:BTB/POZ-like [Macleaya cordata]